MEAGQRPAAPRGPARPAHSARSPCPLASSGLGPTRAPPRVAHATSPASGRRPTTRGRRRRAFSSWSAGSGGSGDSQRPKQRGPDASKSPSGSRSGRYHFTPAQRDGDVMCLAGPRANQNGSQGVPRPPERPAAAHWVSEPEGEAAGSFRHQAAGR